MTFSGNWYGPNWLLDRVTSTGRPWVVRYDRAIRSLPALAAEYGDRGVSVSVSVNEPSSIEP